MVWVWFKVGLFLSIESRWLFMRAIMKRVVLSKTLLSPLCSGVAARLTGVAQFSNTTALWKGEVFYT